MATTAFVDEYPEYHRVHEFPNGYGASVVRHAFSYGGSAGFYELAVLHDGEIVYDTPITNDVIGWLTMARVGDLLHDIAALPPRHAELLREVD